MLSSSEIKSLLAGFPGFNETLLSLQYAPRLPKGMIKETKEMISSIRILFFV